MGFPRCFSQKLGKTITHQQQMCEEGITHHSAFIVTHALLCCSQLRDLCSCEVPIPKMEPAVGFCCSYINIIEPFSIKSLLF